jgi:hypothetical protein
MHNPIAKRMGYDVAKQTLKAANFSDAAIQRAHISQSYLRLEASLSTTVTQFTFDTLVNEQLNPNFVTQQKLNLQDVFLCEEIGIFIGLAASSSVSETQVKLYSYPNSSVFTGANVSNSLYTLYNGALSVQVGQTVLLPSWDINRHMYVPQTQQVAANVGLVPAAGAVQDMIALGHDCFFPVVPQLTINGAAKNIISLNMNSTLTAVLANTRVVLFMRGLLAKDVTNVR